MNLLLDIGNTRLKAALAAKGELVRTTSLRTTDLSLLRSFIRTRDRGRCLFASVINQQEEIVKVLQEEGWTCLSLDLKMPLPFTIGYQSPETLGADRIAAIAGACTIHPGKTVMVIDAGTAITYDFLMEGRLYSGGNISPGISMRFRALHQFTRNLPECAANDQNPEIGYDTASAIIGGVQQGVIFEINEYIRQFQKKHTDSPVILTGGDAHFLERFLSDEILIDTDLVLRGLNRIAEL